MAGLAKHVYNIWIQGWQQFFKKVMKQVVNVSQHSSYLEDGKKCLPHKVIALTL